MTRIDYLAVKNIRSHQDLKVSFSSGTTVITGSNGAGKTSLIEAIYIAMRGSSFKGSDRDILNTDNDWWRIDVKTPEEEIVVKFDTTKNLKKKQFEIDENIYYRLPNNQKKPIVLFEPDDLRLIHGSPSRRRQFIDRFITQLDFSYSKTLSRYEKAIKQRNSLLQRDTINNDELFAWNIMLSDYGSKIVKKRLEYIDLLNKTLNNLYSHIANNNTKISIDYSHDQKDFTETAFLNQLSNGQARDMILKNTSIGPHRHDLIFNYDHKIASKIVSRGESRTIILALKLSELEIIKNIFNDQPIVLLDDVFSELDHQRQLSLSTIANDSQVIITSAHTPDNLTVNLISLD